MLQKSIEGSFILILQDLAYAVFILKHHDLDAAAYKRDLESCRGDLRAFIDEMNCNPIIVRLAWHDAGTYDKPRETGGADGSIRFDEELGHGANAGLSKAIRYLKKFKDAYPRFHGLISSSSRVQKLLRSQAVLRLT